MLIIKIYLIMYLFHSIFLYFSNWITTHFG